jgi:hypothetical protein
MEKLLSRRRKYSNKANYGKLNRWNKSEKIVLGYGMRQSDVTGKV